MGAAAADIEPSFTRKNVMHFAPAMQRAAADLIDRWRRNGPSKTIDVKHEMSGFALDCLMRSIFAEGLGDDFNRLRTSLIAFFANSGGIDPFDIIGLPDFVPRLTRLRDQRLLRPFDVLLGTITLVNAIWRAVGALGARIELIMTRHVANNPVRMLQAVGCEAVAKYVFDHVSKFVGRETHGRVWLESVEVREHGGNSAIYADHHS